MREVYRHPLGDSRRGEDEKVQKLRAVYDCVSLGRDLYETWLEQGRIEHCDNPNHRGNTVCLHVGKLLGVGEAWSQYLVNLNAVASVLQIVSNSSRSLEDAVNEVKGTRPLKP